MATNSGQLSLEDVDRITSIGQACKWIDKLGISNTERNLDIERAKLMIKNHIQNSRGSSPTQRKAPPMADRDTTTAAMKEDLNLRQKLKGIYKEAQSYAKSLPDIFKNDLNQTFPDFIGQMSNMEEELTNSQCLLLVAGELGAGKSSVVNLLLGHTIMPTSELRCTAAIVEISYGASPKAIITWKDDSSGRSITPIVRQCDSRSEEGNFLRDLETYIIKRDVDTDESPFEKIQLFWPIEMLKGGVVIVDSPGVGDARGLPQQLASYMERACGFIYVIDSTCAIHKHRLGQLLLKAIETTNGFDPYSTLFVCNRWDHVKESDHDRVLTAVADRLSLILPDVKKSQLYPISAMKCLKQIEYGQVLPEHRNLVEGMRRFLPQAMRGKLRRYYKFLWTILKRSLYTLRMSYTMNKRRVEDIKSTYDTVQQRLKRLQGDAEKLLHQMRKEVKSATFEAGQDLMSHLDSMKTRMRLMAWHEDECPKRERTWQNVLKTASLVISEKIAQEINYWEHSTDRVASLQKDILLQFQEKFEVFGNQLHNIERALAHDVQAETNFNMSVTSSLSSKKGGKLAKLSKGAPAFLSLGNSVTSGFSLDPKNAELRTLFKDKYQSDPCRAMAKATEIFLGFLNETVVVSSLVKFFDRLVKSIDKIGTKIPELIKADQQLLEKLNSDLHSGERKLGEYPSMSGTVANLQGRLDLLYVQRLMVSDFTADQLDYRDKVKLGKGSFANVYKGTLKIRPGDSVVVAIKEPKDPVNVAEVTDMLLEETMLREIDNVNIVKYYGVCRTGPEADLRLIMVMEFCPYTLKARCIGTENSANSPSKLGAKPAEQSKSVLEVLNFLVQICNGLRYLHNKNIVHRDLKPDNVLLTAESKVRIADLGLAKKVKDIVTLNIGTPVYMAPEILSILDKYDTLADIYSLAMIMWELWYGRDLAEYAAMEIQGGLKQNIESGWRPKMSAVHPPPDYWQELMTKCWNQKAAERPTAETVGRTLSQNMMEIQ